MTGGCINAKGSLKYRQHHQTSINALKCPKNVKRMTVIIFYSNFNYTYKHDDLSCSQAIRPELMSNNYTVRFM